jgi:ABC-2 type transport system permease protein
MSAPNVLLPVHGTDWRQGFANLLSKDNGTWWHTSRWWSQIIIWVLILNGILAVQLFAVPETATSGPGDPLTNGIVIFMTMSMVTLTIGAIITAQGAVIDEKRSGTAAWVLSKPVSRTAFILSKLSAHGLGLLVTGILIPGTLAFIMLSVAGTPVALGGFAAGLVLVFVNVLLYLTLTLMLGTLFDGRGAVIAIPLAFLFSAQLLIRLAPWLAAITPWGFLFGAPGTQPPVVQVALGQASLPVSATIASLGWCVLFTAVALWRFGREEF